MEVMLAVFRLELGIELTSQGNRDSAGVNGLGVGQSDDCTQKQQRLCQHGVDILDAELSIRCQFPQLLKKIPSAWFYKE